MSENAGSRSAVRNEADARVTLVFGTGGLFLPRPPAGFAPDDALTGQHDADSCAARPEKLSINAKTAGTLGGASINGPAAALFSMKSTSLLPLGCLPKAIPASTVANISNA